MNWLAQLRAFCKSSSEIDGYMETTSKEINLSLFLSGRSLNHLIWVFPLIVSRFCFYCFNNVWKNFPRDNLYVWFSGVYQPNLWILLKVILMVLKGDSSWPCLSFHNPISQVVTLDNLLLLLNCSPEVCFSCFLVIFVNWWCDQLLILFFFLKTFSHKFHFQIYKTKK